MIFVRQAAPSDYTAILDIWADQLPQDWMGHHRFVKYVLSDPLIGPDSWWVIVEGQQITGFMAVSQLVDRTRHIGAIAVHRLWQHQGLGRILWTKVRDYFKATGTGSVVWDGILPHVFIPGIDRDAYPVAFAWMLQEGFKEMNPVVAMEKSLDNGPMLDNFSDAVQLASGNVNIGIVPAYLRGEALRVAVKDFGMGWARALRETWLEEVGPERVLGIFSEREIFGISVAGGYGQPIGRLGPIGVVDKIRGQGMGALLLEYTLRYMRTHKATHAYFLHCDVGIPAYTMYLNHGFKVTRTFVPLKIDLR